MYQITKKFIRHGIVTVNYPQKPVSADFVTGKPVIDVEKCTLCRTCAAKCPTQALATAKNDSTRIQVSLDRCIFCTICEEVCPNGAIRMSSQFELAAASKNDISQLKSVNPETTVKELNRQIRRRFGRSLQIREVDAGSCNGCDNEANALNGPYNDIERLSISFVASPRHADMLLVTGPVTDNMELALIKTYQATPDPKLVAAVGSCACSGGIFAGSYAAKRGVDSVLPVDVYIPGCPPRPQAIIYGILKAIGKNIGK